MSDRVLAARDSGVLTLTINRPEARNALDRETIEALGAHLDYGETDAAVAAVIVTGAGDKVFVSGADVRELRARTRRDALDARLSRFYERLERFPKLTVAAVNGYALGGGAELALACDLRLAAESARFGFPELGLGVIPSAGGTQRLPRLVGLGRAKHLILTGDIIDAEEARRIGLVSEVVPLADLALAAQKLAQKVVARGPLAVRLAKLALDAAHELPRGAGLAFESLAQAIAYESKDKIEGTTAFLDKRKPSFTGE